MSTGAKKLHERLVGWVEQTSSLFSLCMSHFHRAFITEGPVGTGCHQSAEDSTESQLGSPHSLTYLPLGLSFRGLKVVLSAQGPCMRFCPSGLITALLDHA